MTPPGQGPARSELSLLVDLYELTMAASFHAERREYLATFELFSRELPPRRNFLVAAGLEQALDHLESLRFGSEDLQYLRSLELFEEDFLEFLGDLRFTGEVHAFSEGEIIFPPEPILRVTAPLIEAQIVETFLLNTLDFQTMVASKSARIALAASGTTFVDFSARRDHGADAAVMAARAAFIGGASATSNLLAARRFGISPSGTMAHSYVMTMGDEKKAFLTFARHFPNSATLLIDTYDTLQGARKAAEAANELASEGIRVRGVRIDSGDLLRTVPLVREALDDAGHPEIEIFVSGELDEDRIATLMRAGTPVDGFGVGTALGTSSDAPYIGGVYKLVEDFEGPRLKLSAGKATLPGTKQVYRFYDAERASGDLITLGSEPAPTRGRSLLKKVMERGVRLHPPEPLLELQARCKKSIEELPEHLRSLDAAEPYPVEISQSLLDLKESFSVS